MNKLPFPAGMEVENFKCFGQRVTVPFAPITLLYGENSSGKSAIIQLLCMLRHTLDLGFNDPILVSRDANGLVDLGRYSDYVHDHDLDRDVSVSFISPRGYARGFAAGYDKASDSVVPRRWKIKTPDGEHALHVHRDSLILEPDGVVYTDIPCWHAQLLCECAAKHPDLVIEGIRKTIQLQVLQQVDPETTVSIPPWNEEPFRSAYTQFEQNYKPCMDLMRGSPSAEQLLSITQLVSYRLYGRSDKGGQRAWQPSLVATEGIALPMLENWLLIGASNVMLARRSNVGATAEEPHEFAEWDSWTLAVARIIKDKLIGLDLALRNARLTLDVYTSRWAAENADFEGYDADASSNRCFVNTLRWGSEGQVTAEMQSCEIYNQDVGHPRFLCPDKVPDVALRESPATSPSDTLRLEHFHARRDVDPRQLRHHDPARPCYVHGFAPSYWQSEFTDWIEELNYPVGVDWVTRFISIGPLRQEPARWYEVYDLPRIGVGRKGEHTSEYLRQHPELQESLNAWLHRLGIDYKVAVETVVPMERMPALGILKLTDLRRDNPVATTIADVGMGISQVLPIVAECLCEKEKWIGIEQPELHIHPRLQAELGSLFADSYKEKGNRFLIETHSEHLLLRLQRLIRTGVLTSEDVAVAYVSRGTGGSEVQRLRLDKRGEFIDDWPKGFFPERLAEILGG